METPKAAERRYFRTRISAVQLHFPVDLHRQTDTRGKYGPVKLLRLEEFTETAVTVPYCDAK